MKTSVKTLLILIATLLLPVCSYADDMKPMPEGKPMSMPMGKPANYQDMNAMMQKREKKHLARMGMRMMRMGMKMRMHGNYLSKSDNEDVRAKGQKLISLGTELYNTGLSFGGDKAMKRRMMRGHHRHKHMRGGPGHGRSRY